MEKQKSDSAENRPLPTVCPKCGSKELSFSVCGDVTIAFYGEIPEKLLRNKKKTLGELLRAAQPTEPMGSLNDVEFTGSLDYTLTCEECRLDILSAPPQG